MRWKDGDVKKEKIMNKQVSGKSEDAVGAREWDI